MNEWQLFQHWILWSADYIFGRVQSPKRQSFAKSKHIPTEFHILISVSTCWHGDLALQTNCWGNFLVLIGHLVVDCKNSTAIVPGLDENLFQTEGTDNYRRTGVWDCFKATCNSLAASHSGANPLASHPQNCLLATMKQNHPVRRLEIRKRCLVAYAYHEPFFPF